MLQARKEKRGLVCAAQAMWPSPPSSSLLCLSLPSRAGPGPTRLICRIQTAPSLSFLSILARMGPGFASSTAQLAFYYSLILSSLLDLAHACHVSRRPSPSLPFLLRRFPIQKTRKRTEPLFPCPTVTFLLSLSSFNFHN